MFYGYLAVASVSLRLPTQFVHCCLAATRAFMAASLIVIPYTILEISKFLGQLPVDSDDDDEKCQLNTGIASLRSELGIVGTRENHIFYSECRKIDSLPNSAQGVASYATSPQY